MKINNKNFITTLTIIYIFSYVNYLKATIENGNIKIYPALNITAGGENSSGGVFSLTAAGMGGTTDSTQISSGGNYTISLGPVQSSVILPSAASNLSSAHCYPNPFKPSLGHTKIRFIGLTQTAKIMIFTLSGELVKTINKSDSNNYKDWDVKNENGKPVFSGVYIYVIKNTFETKKGKLMIIR